jgi:TPP-dependent pyruvate/acetoin dehydrogenase alpha subunit
MSRLGKRELHELFYYMKLTRRLEEEVASLHRERKIEGSLFLGMGQEAVSVGTAYRLGSTDAIASSLPSFGHLLALGVQPTEIFAHVLGKDTGPTGGRDGSIFFGDWRRGVVSPSGHPATHLGVLAGVALASKSQSRSGVTVALADERSVATGDFHEGLNFAAVHRLALIVVVDQVPLPAAEDQALYDRMRGYGVPSLPVDGVDILQVLQVIETAIDRARGGKGPTLVEVRSARGPRYGFDEDAVPFPFVGGRSVAPIDPDDRAEDEPSRDPVGGFESFLVDHTLLQPVERGLILERIERLVADGRRSAEKDSFPGADLLENGVYDTSSSRTEAASGSDTV